MNPLDLIDHPPADAEPPRNGALTAQVMERVQRAARPAAPGPARWPWLVAALITIGLVWLPLDWEPDADLVIDPLLLLEWAATGLIALLILARSRSPA